MSVLQNFPIVNQLTDNNPNSEYDCVPSSLAASMTFLLGRQVAPADLKDAVYGHYYVGPTSIDTYTSVCTSYGIDLVAVACSSPQEAVQQAHAILAQGSPVVFTQQDDYAPAHPDWTHVCVWFADDVGSLTAMDPFGGKSLLYSDDTWATRLRDNHLWKMEMINMINLSTPGVSNFFTGDSQRWHCIATQKDIAYAILGFYQSFGGKDLCGLTHLGMPLTNELTIGNGRTVQFFERGVLCYDPQHSNDSPPGCTGSVYLAHIDNGPGQDPRIAQLQAQIVQLQQTQSPNLIPVVQNLQSILSQINKLSEIPS